MEVNKKRQLVKNYVKDIRSEKYDMNCWFQRKEDQWSRRQKSLLIDSLLKGYIVDPIKAKQEDNVRYIFDGIQRSTSIAEFIEDKYALYKKIKPIVIDDNLYEIGGKKFSELDQILQDRINNFEIDIYIVTDATDEEIQEMFLYQNNGKPLSNTQKRGAIESRELSEAISSVASHPFFEKVLSPVQLKRDVQKDLAREALMLLNSNEEHDFANFTARSIDTFTIWQNENFNEKSCEPIVDTLDVLDEKLDKIDIKPLSIPMILAIGAMVLQNNKDFDKFANEIETFAETYNDNEDYKKFCNDATTSAKAVKGRFDYWLGIYNNL